MATSSSNEAVGEAIQEETGSGGFQSKRSRSGKRKLSSVTPMECDPTSDVNSHNATKRAKLVCYEVM